MSRTSEADKTILSAKAATGWGTAQLARSSRHLVLSVSTTGTATLTFKVAKSNSDAIPDFTSAATAANHWDYVAVYDENDPSSIIAGDTGVAVAGTDIVKNYIINTDYAEHVNVQVTAFTQGSVTAVLSSVND